MIERNRDYIFGPEEQEYTVYCDKCPHEQTFEEIHGWEDLMTQMKEYGWKSQKKGDDWEHICSGCQELGG